MLTASPALAGAISTGADGGGGDGRERKLRVAGGAVRQVILPRHQLGKNPLNGPFCAVGAAREEVISWLVNLWTGWVLGVALAALSFQARTPRGGRRWKL